MSSIKKISLDTNIIFNMQETNNLYEESQRKDGTGLDKVNAYINKNMIEYKNKEQSIIDYIDKVYSNLKYEEDSIVKSKYNTYKDIRVQLSIYDMQKDFGTTAKLEEQRKNCIQKLILECKSLKGVVNFDKFIKKETAKKVESEQKIANLYTKVLTPIIEREIFIETQKINSSGFSIQRLNRLKEKYERVEEFTQNSFDTFNDNVGAYYDIAQQLDSANLLLGQINGEIEFCITSDVYQELKNHYASGQHINQVSGRPISDKDLIDEQSVLNITQKSTLVTIKDKTTLNVLDKIVDILKDREMAKVMGGENGTMTAYIDEINSLNESGDLYILVLSNITGINIATQNVSHYIGDNNLIGSDYMLVADKRKWLKYIVEHKELGVPQYMTNACPYMVSEILTGQELTSGGQSDKDIFDTPIGDRIKVTPITTSIQEYLAEQEKQEGSTLQEDIELRERLRKDSQQFAKVVVVERDMGMGGR